MNRKCHNCNGEGKVSPINKQTKEQSSLAGKCYYCRGKGYRTNNYGRGAQ